jgi:dihydrolipoamide dehydrogenase
MRYDIAIIGGGPGGYVGAIVGAQQGFKVVLIERDALGGTCLNRGCISTKSWIRDSRQFYQTVSSSVLKGAENVTFDAPGMLLRKEKVVSTLVGGVGSLLKSNGVDVINGIGQLTSPGKIRVRGADGTMTKVEASQIILATGSRPSVPPFLKVDGKIVQTTDEALGSDIIPEKLVIVGGGVIGMEMATIYLNLGSSVTIIELLPDILTTEDEDVRKTMKQLLKKEGAGLFLKSGVKSIKIRGGKAMVSFEDDKGATQQIEADKVLIATGRAPVMDGLGVKKLGLEMSGPYIKVNAGYQTSVKGIYAIGDLIGGMMLAHKASAEAETLVEGLASGHVPEVKPELIPRCVWSMTEVGAVGLTEEQARDTGRPVKVGMFPFAGSGAAQAYGKPVGFAKIIGDRDTGEILGAHIVGEHATDMISEVVTVMKMEGVVEDLAEAVKPHPTLSETVLEAALDWNGKAIHAPKKRR